MTSRPPFPTGAFPRTRMRRNRRDAWSRRLVREARLAVDDLVWPVFIQEGEGARTPVESMPGIERLTIDVLLDSVGEAAALGIPAVALFPAVDPSLKTETCEEAYNPDGLVCRAARALKSAHPGIGVICDVALDPYNSLGHDGLVRGGYVVNDETIEVLCKQALAQAAAGADVVAPSEMMDGRVGAIRDALDAGGFERVRILSYAAKYASSFYGPFREAVRSAAALGQGDKRTYQMDPGNTDEALREVALDIAEGADMVMIKPGLPYLDVLRRVKEAFGVPTFAYQVSGEYAMLKAAGLKGWLEWDQVLIETLLSMKRAGADAVFTYAALEVARRLRAET